MARDNLSHEYLIRMQTKEREWMNKWKMIWLNISVWVDQRFTYASKLFTIEAGKHHKLKMAGYYQHIHSGIETFSWFRNKHEEEEEDGGSNISG